MKGNNYNDIKARLIKASGGKLNEADVEKIKKGNLSSVKGMLSDEERKTLLRLLNDKAAAKKILDSPAVRDILGGKKN